MPPHGPDRDLPDLARRLPDGGRHADPARRLGGDGGGEGGCAEPGRRGDDDHGGRRRLHRRHRDRVALAGLPGGRLGRGGNGAALRAADPGVALEPGGDGAGVDAVRAGAVEPAGPGLRGDQGAEPGADRPGAALRSALRRAGALRARSDRLPVARAGRRDLGVPEVHPRRPGAARGGREPRRGACARLSRHSRPDRGHRLRGRLRGAGRRLSEPRARAAMDRGHDGRGGVDRAGHRRLRVLEGGARARRRLSFRRNHRLAAQPSDGGARVPVELLSAAPYLVTIAVLVLISARAGRGGDAPACLGRPFHASG